MRSNQKYSVICFSFMPWSKMWKRNQSMMAELAKVDFIDKVTFVNPELWIKNIFRSKKHNSNLSSGFLNKLFPQRKAANIWVYTPLHFLPFKKRLPVMQKIESQIMLSNIKILNSRLPYILFINCPNISSNYILDKLLEGAALSIFDFSDDFPELVRTEEGKEFYYNNIKKYAGKADIILTVNEHLRTKYGYLNYNIHVLRNATNYGNFDRKSFKPIDSLEKIKNKKQPIIGYTGWINSSRIDFNLLDFLLERRPDWQFFFIGPAEKTFNTRYSKYENVYIHPPVDYLDLPNYMNYFDVTIVPFQVNAHTKGNDLLKFHDYLAMGKPVVTTNLPCAEKLKDVVEIASCPEEFLAAIDKAIEEKGGNAVERRKQAALKNSWETRSKELEAIIKKMI